MVWNLANEKKLPNFTFYEKKWKFYYKYVLYFVVDAPKMDPEKREEEKKEIKNTNKIQQKAK